MQEKGDLGEAVSLPPGYAASDTFTDSPPPAYQRKNNAKIRIARMVCLTVLACTFLVGFFVVAHRWVEARNVIIIDENPSAQHLTAAEEENFDENRIFLEPIVKGASLISLDIDNNKIEDDIQAKDGADDQIVFNGPEASTEIQEDEQVMPQQVVPAQFSLPPFLPKGLLGPFQDQINNVNSPFSNIMNSPPQMGPKGNCRTEKRQKHIGPGIMTETVVVICSNEIGENQMGDMMPPPPLAMPFPPPGARRIEPPMSLLSTIMKVLASKQNKANGEQGRPRVVQLMPMDDSFPIIPPQPIRGETQEIPPPIRGSPQELPPFPFMNMIPLAKIEVRGRVPVGMQNFHEMQGQNNDNEVELLPPFHPRMHFNGPFPFPQEEEQDNFDPRMRPAIKVIRINRPNNIDEEGDMSQQPPFNFPFNPIMAMINNQNNNRRGRVLRIKPRMNEDNLISGPFPFPPMMFPDDMPFERHLPHPVPEASGRALPDPVALPLPGMKLLRLPFRPPRHFPLDSRITHMEMKQAPSPFERAASPFDRTRSFRLSPFQQINLPQQSFNKMFPHEHEHHEHQDHIEHNHEQNFERRFPFSPNQNEEVYDFSDRENENNGHFNGEIEDFGPPRTHTLIQHSNEPNFIQNENEEHMHQENNPNFHTHADGVSHSHPHNGPHTHIGGEIIPITPEFAQQTINNNFHTHEDGHSHSHPHDGPHTHMNGEIIPLRSNYPEQNADFRPMEGEQPQPELFHMDPFQQEQNPDFPNQDQEDFFISEPSFNDEQEILEGDQQIREEPMFEHHPGMFELQSVFENQEPRIHFTQQMFRPEDEFRPEEVNFQQQEPNFQFEERPLIPLDPMIFSQEPHFMMHEPELQPENLNLQQEENNFESETDFQPQEPIVQPEEQTFQSEQPTEEINFQPEISLLPEEATLVDEPVFDSETLEHFPHLFVEEPELIENLEEQENHGDVRGYAPEGKIAPIPPQIENQAEIVEPEDVPITEESLVLIK